MISGLRWILVVPAAIGATVAAFAAGTVVWNVVRWINIVPQDGVVDLIFANAGVNALAAAAGVVAGSRVAPTTSRWISIAICSLLVGFAVVTLWLGNEFRGQLRMSYGWHLTSALAWIAGAIAAAYALARASEQTSERLQQRPPSTR